MLGDRCESKCLLPLPQEILFEISELLSSRFIWVVIELDAWRVAAGEEFPNLEIDTILGQIHTQYLEMKPTSDIFLRGIIII